MLDTGNLIRSRPSNADKHCGHFITSFLRAFGSQRKSSETDFSSPGARWSPHQPYKHLFFGRQLTPPPRASGSKSELVAQVQGLCTGMGTQGGLGAQGCCQVPHPACRPHTQPELPGASLKSGPCKEGSLTSKPFWARVCGPQWPWADHSQHPLQQPAVLAFASQHGQVLGTLDLHRCT